MDRFGWGLIPPWARDTTIGSKAFDARAETVTTNPMFRHAFRKHRALVPVDGFYEWRRTEAESSSTTSPEPTVNSCGRSRWRLHKSTGVMRFFGFQRGLGSDHIRARDRCLPMNGTLGIPILVSEIAGIRVSG